MRSVLAILAGYLALILFSVSGGILLAMAFRGSGIGASLLIGGETVAFLAALLAGAITARVAMRRPLLHASILGLVIFTIAVAVSVAQRPTAHAPSWYPFSVAVLGAVGAFVGGALSSARQAR